jgi:hypothetical protein
MSDKSISWKPMSMYVADVLYTFGGLKGMNAKKITRRGTILTITLNSGDLLTVNPLDTITQGSYGELTIKKME